MPYLDLTNLAGVSRKVVIDLTLDDQVIARKRPLLLIDLTGDNEVAKRPRRFQKSLVENLRDLPRDVIMKVF